MLMQASELEDDNVELRKKLQELEDEAKEQAGEKKSEVKQMFPDRCGMFLE
jgi:hypothetical protein